MKTIDRIAQKTAQKTENIAKISSLQTLIQERKVVRYQYARLLEDCPKIGGGNCRDSRKSSLQQVDSQMAGYNMQIQTLTESNKVIDQELIELKKQAETERQNSVIATETLANQGLTIQAVESAAEVEAETQSAIAREFANQDLEQDKNLNYIWIALLVVVLIALVVFLVKRFKNKK